MAEASLNSNESNQSQKLIYDLSKNFLGNEQKPKKKALESTADTSKLEKTESSVGGESSQTKENKNKGLFGGFFSNLFSNKPKTIKSSTEIASSGESTLYNQEDGKTPQKGSKKMKINPSKF